MAVATAIVDIPKWKLELALRMSKAGGNFQNGTMSRNVREIGSLYGIPWQTVQYSYYKYVNHGFPEDIQQAIQTVTSRLVKDEGPEAPPKEPEQPENPPQDTATEPEAQAKGLTPECMVDAKQDTVTAVIEQEKTQEPEIPTIIDPEPPKGRLDIEYTTGTTVEVRITEIRSYGAFCEATDGTKTDGLIHISEICNEFVSDVNAYFHVGDVIKAKVKRWDEDKGRMELTTKNMREAFKPKGTKNLGASLTLNIPERNTLAEKLEPYKAQLEEMARKNADKAPKTPETPVAQQQEKQSAADKKAEKAVPLENKSETADRTDKISNLYAVMGTDEMKQIRAYITSITNALSPEAEQMFVDLIENAGVFKFALALSQTASKFQPDLGVMLAQAVEREVAKTEKMFLGK